MIRLSKNRNQQDNAVPRTAGLLPLPAHFARELGRIEPGTRYGWFGHRPLLPAPYWRFLSRVLRSTGSSDLSARIHFLVWTISGGDFQNLNKVPLPPPLARWLKG